MAEDRSHSKGSVEESYLSSRTVYIETIEGFQQMF